MHFTNFVRFCAVAICLHKINRFYETNRLDHLTLQPQPELNTTKLNSIQLLQNNTQIMMNENNKFYDIDEKMEEKKIKVEKILLYFYVLP
jgi:hypothetical protein